MTLFVSHALAVYYLYVPLCYQGDSYKLITYLLRNGLD